MKQLGKNKIFPLIMGFVLLAVIFFARGPLQRGLSFFEYPFVYLGTWITDKTHFVGFKAAGQMDQLMEQKNSCLVDLAELQSLRTENQQLKDQLLFIERSNKKYLSARIINRAISDYSSTFVIDRGRDDGIAVNAPVIVDNGILIGKVIAVGPASATVAAVTDQASATAVALLNKTNTIGIAKGTTGGLIKLQFIPQNEEIKVNDLVVTSGIEESVPSGLVVGVVNYVSGLPTDPFKEAIIEPLLDARRRHLVTVIITPLQP